MKFTHLSIAFLSLIISHNNFCMERTLQVSGAKNNNLGIVHAVKEAYHPEAVHHFDERDEYEPSCQDLIIGYDAFMFARQISTTLLPHDPIVASLSGLAACAATIFAAKKIKTAYTAKVKMD